MAMPVHVPDLDWTVERALALPDDGNRYEVLDGELFVTPAPSWGHQSVLATLNRRLDDFVEANGLGWTRWSPADIVFSPRRLLQPDLFVVPWRDGGPPRGWSDVTTLLLAVEVLSPSTARADRHRKRVIYQSEGITEYWIVDGDARLIERWRPGDERPEILHDSLAWQPAPGLAPLIIDLPALFDAASR
jgi:Uma2 family endonuclease